MGFWKRIGRALFGNPGPRLSDEEKAVLEVLGPKGGEVDWWGYSFAELAQITALSRQEVGAACRSLALKGFAAFERSRWDEDGRPCGSGYRATSAGRRYHEASQ